MKMAEVDRLRKLRFTTNVPIPWIDVRSLADADTERARELNLRCYLPGEDIEDETDDEILIDCLDAHLSQQPKEKEDVTAEQLVEAAVYLIVRFWSGYAGHLAMWNHLLDSDNINRCVCCIQNAFYSHQHWIPRWLLRSFTIELFSPRYDEVEMRKVLL